MRKNLEGMQMNYTFELTACIAYIAAVFFLMAAYRIV